MNKALLYLLQKGNLDSNARTGVIEQLLGMGQHNALPQNNNKTLPVRNIVVVTAIYTASTIDVVMNVLKRYPQLSNLKLQIHHTSKLKTQRFKLNDTSHVKLNNIEDSFLRDLKQADLLINTCPNAEGISTMMEAMASGVPVLIPDSVHRDAPFLKDGINGFLYRTHDTDNLAISLLTLQSVSHDIMHRVVTHASETIATIRLGLSQLEPSTT
jgi:glycosyltransferase involved in cell wall biosynthesis